MAALEGKEAIVPQLLEQGADLNLSGGKYGNALQAAAYKGHEAVVRLLIERGADVNAEGGLYGCALQAAAAGGHQQPFGGELWEANEMTIITLLNHGANVNLKGGLYGSALQAACRSEEELFQVYISISLYQSPSEHYDNTLTTAVDSTSE
jgi:ankyrin repeat protein